MLYVVFPLCRNLVLVCWYLPTSMSFKLLKNKETAHCCLVLHQVSRLSTKS